MLTLLLALWLVPCFLSTIWTLATVFVAMTIPLKTTMPGFTQGNLLVLMYNPKDEFLYRRPEFTSALLVLLIGMLPLVNIVTLGFQLWFTFLASKPTLAKRA